MDGHVPPEAGTDTIRSSLQRESASDDVGGHGADASTTRVGVSAEPVDSLTCVDTKLNGDHAARYVNLCTGERVGGVTEPNVICRGGIERHFYIAEAGDMVLPVRR